MYRQEYDLIREKSQRIPCYRAMAGLYGDHGDKNESLHWLRMLREFSQELASTGLVPIAGDYSRVIGYYELWQRSRGY